MKKLIVTLGCLILILISCGKDDDKATETNENQETAQTEKVKISVDDIAIEEGREFIETIANDPSLFEQEFKKLTAAQQYYFCAAFAMGAMSATKPITASAMVNYFMGLGVAKYNVGINDETYMAFNSGKNTFRFEELVNTILEKKTCEVIMQDATDYAQRNNLEATDLDKRGEWEIKKVVQYIKRSSPEQ